MSHWSLIVSGMLATSLAGFGRWPVVTPEQVKPPNVDAVLTHLDDLYRSTSSIARMEVFVTTPRSTRSLRLKAWTRGEDEALIVIEAPPREEGTATLESAPTCGTTCRALRARFACRHR